MNCLKGRWTLDEAWPNDRMDLLRDVDRVASQCWTAALVKAQLRGGCATLFGRARRIVVQELDDRLLCWVSRRQPPFLNNGVGGGGEGEMEM